MFISLSSTCIQNFSTWHALFVFFITFCSRCGMKWDTACRPTSGQQMIHFELFYRLVHYPASRGFSLVFLSVVLPFSSQFWLLAFCFGCFCAEEKTSADSRLGFLLSMRIRYLRDLGGIHMTKPVVEPVLSTRASFLY